MTTRSTATRRSPIDVLKRAGAGKSRKPKGAFDLVSGKRQYLEPQELVSFFKLMPPTSYWFPYFYIEYFYGCRLSEPALITDDDVNMKKRQITIRRLKKDSEKDGYREHTYEMDERIIACVKTAQRWKEVKGFEENPFLFASNRQRTSGEVGAERLSQLRNSDGWQAVSRFTAHRMFQKVAEAIKLSKELQHSQVLRHTRAVILLAAGAPIEKVTFLLEHSSFKMTERYIPIAESLRPRLTDDLFMPGAERGLGL